MPVGDCVGFWQQQFFCFAEGLLADAPNEFQAIEELATKLAGRQCHGIHFSQKGLQFLDSLPLRCRPADLLQLLRLERGATFDLARVGRGFSFF